MKNRKRLMGLTGTVIVGLLAMVTIAAYGVELPADGSPRKGADVIRIDALKAFGDLERPAVVFQHAKHSDYMRKNNQDCTICHLAQEDRLSYRYMRLQDTNRETVMDIYHVNCIDCHKQVKAEGSDSGPVTCGGCHPETVVAVPDQQPFGMDLSLHYRHSKALENKCELCHHAYDETNKKLFYAKGQEGTCRYCHKAQTEENRISMRAASHQDCIDCHRNTLTQKKDAGPIDCIGCHDAKKQAEIAQLTDIPRMQRNQPDIVFVKSAVDAEGNESTKGAQMAPVPFNHPAHEKANTSCRVCHHADLNSCAKCHTSTGSKEGDYVTLQQAMHRVQSEQSCVGCHDIKQQEPACAGCHADIPVARKTAPETCVHCHMEALPGMGGTDGQPVDPQAAQQLIASRKTVAGTYPIADIPEKVVIKAIVDEYGPVDLPHRKIVMSLADSIKNNQLAAVFHMDPGTLCQGCHHNSPVSKKPPQCASCHGEQFDTGLKFRPGLKAAYHQQCMNCHQRMGVLRPASVDCNACHRKIK